MKIILIALVCLVVAIVVYSMMKSQKPNQHLSAPMKEETPPINHEEMIAKIKSSPYFKELQPLATHVSGQTVTNSITGNSGFILMLDDDSWVCSYRDGNVVGSSFGKSQPTDDIKNLISNSEYGNASEPIAQNTIYANEICDIPQEVAKSHGIKLDGLAFGKDAFNFAFEGGFELDVKLVEDKRGKPAFRVFWEQW